MLESETKLDLLELNVLKTPLSRILDMMYTEVSKTTRIRVKELKADIQLFILGIDAGLLPSHVYPTKRLPAKNNMEETYIGIPLQKE